MVTLASKLEGTAFPNILEVRSGRELIWLPTSAEVLVPCVGDSRRRRGSAQPVSSYGKSIDQLNAPSLRK